MCDIVCSNKRKFVLERASLLVWLDPQLLSSCSRFIVLSLQTCAAVPLINRCQSSAEVMKSLEIL